MRLSARLIATAAFVVFLMSAFKVCAGEAARLSAGDEKAADSSGVYAAEPDAPMPEAYMAAAMPYSRGLNVGVPRFELFAGYSYLRAVPTMAAGNRLVWMNGGSTSLAFNINRHLGLVGDFGVYTNSAVQFTGAYTGTVNVNNSNVAALTYLFGPRLSFRNHDRITPFAQVLFGGMRANLVTLANCTSNCTVLPVQNSFAMTAGGGLDIRLQRHFAIRIIQAEYLMTRFTSYTTGLAGTQNDMRLSSGIVFRFGGNPRIPELPPVSYSCSVNPAAVYPGDSIAVSGTAINLDPAKTAVYTWSGWRNGEWNHRDGGDRHEASCSRRLHPEGSRLRGRQASRECGLLRTVCGEGVRTADCELHSRSLHSDLRQPLHDYGNRREPTKSPVDLQL